eukprot:5593182-Pleurochrysis_carterae.AAC.1
MPVFAAAGATAAATLFVVATKKGAAQASSARSGNVRASRSAARATEGRGMCLEEEASPGRESPNMRSPEALRSAWGKRTLHTEAGPPSRLVPGRVRHRGSAATASQARTGKIQLWAR